MFKKIPEKFEKANKGQIVLIDFVFALSIFLLLFGTIYFYYLNNLGTFESEIKMREMRSLAEMSLDTLLNSKGVPTNWSASDVTVIGIASNSKIINESKFSKMQALGYDALKQKLLFGKYDVLLKFKNSQETITLGQAPLDTNYLRVTLTAIVLKKGVNINVEFTVYE